MVNKNFWFGILVILLVFGMTVVGCDIPEKESEEEAEINWNGHRYVIYAEKKSWTDARDYCKSKGGHLATITSLEEQESVYGLINKKGAKNLYWIGGCKTDGNWVWVTGEQWEYTNWDSGEPNSDGNEYYLQMYRISIRSSGVGKWNDEDNSGNANDENYSLNNIGFICEWDY